MSTLTIELSDDLAARLAAASERAQVPPSQIVQDALARTLVGKAEESGRESRQPTARRSRGRHRFASEDLIGCHEGDGRVATNAVVRAKLASRRL